MNDIPKTNIARAVEAPYGRLEIRRDESQAQNRKKRDRGDEDYKPDLWDEIAHVSVMALYNFLGALLISRLSPENPPPVTSSTEFSQPQTSVQKRAIGAYNRQSARGAGVDLTINEVDDGHETSARDASIILADDVSDEDIKRIQQFQRDLMALNQRGVVEIELVRADNFFAAIEAGIQAAQQNK